MIVIDISMPKRCIDCFAKDMTPYSSCKLTLKHTEFTDMMRERREDCPLREIGREEGYGL